MWVETEPSWVCLIFDGASFSSPTQCASRGEESFWENTPREEKKNTTKANF